MHRQGLNFFFIVTALLGLAVFAWFAFAYAKGTPELWINTRSHLYADKFFLYATEVGHGLFFTAVVIVLLFRHVGYALLVALTGIVCSILSNTLKRMVYADSPRPPKFFEGMDLHFVEGSQVLYHHSFPSGHTMTAFALCFLLSHYFSRKEWGIPLALLAVAVALSRVYLLKHFFVDVFTGGVIGLVIALLMHYVLLPTAQKWNYRLSMKGILRNE